MCTELAEPVVQGELKWTKKIIYCGEVADSSLSFSMLDLLHVHISCVALWFPEKITVGVHLLMIFAKY